MVNLILTFLEEVDHHKPAKYVIVSSWKEERCDNFER